MAPPLKMILSIVCLVLQFIVLLFVVVATPIDAFSGGARSCYSMWGLKRCGEHGYNYHGLRWKGFPCREVRDLMNTAAAFAIFSIFITLIAFVLTIVNFVGILKTANLIALILGVLAFLTILVSWACMAGARDHSCSGSKLSYSYSYAGAFGLMVTAWILELAVCVLLFFA